MVDRVINAMTVDVEDWYQTHDLDIDSCRWDSFEDRVENGTDMLIDLFSRYNVRATFFVLGCVALKHPRLVRRISDQGHEIGSHGYGHCMVIKQTRDIFRDELIKSKKLLEDITGKEVKSYRAPSWSITRSTLWALEILEEEGFACDSSIQPFKTPLSGIHGAPIVPFYPVIRGRRLSILEFPPTVLPLWKFFRLPFAGGLYLRVMPGPFIAKALTIVNRERPAMVYIHPWELDTGQPRLKVSLLRKAAHYINLNTAYSKIEGMLKGFNFQPLGNFVNKGVQEAYPSFNLTGT